MFVFDAYEIRARLAPALVVASPWVFVGVALIQQSTSTLASTSAAATVFLALLYGFSFAVRNLGKRIEPGLWSSSSSGFHLLARFALTVSRLGGTPNFLAYSLLNCVGLR